MNSKGIPNLNDPAKKSLGRQKIEMKKISSKSNLQVAFSKRRNGVFKKASELVTLCGVDVAIVVFSPSNRVFSFGSPNVDSVIKDFDGRIPAPPLLNLDLNEAYRTADETGLHAHINCLSNQIVEEKRRGDDLDLWQKSVEDQIWWATPIESMNNAQLEKYKKILKEMKTQVNEEKQKLFFDNAFTFNSSTQFFAGESSSSGATITGTVHPPPLMPNNEGVNDDMSILRHNESDNMHGDITTYGFF